MPTAEEMLAEAKAQQAIEWGTYVATGPIDIGGVRAFNEGQEVPVSHVTSGLVEQDQVRKVNEAPADPPADSNPEADPAADQKVA